MVVVDGVVYESIASILLAHLLTALELILQNVDKIAECEGVEQGQLGFEPRTWTPVSCLTFNKLLSLTVSHFPPGKTRIIIIHSPEG